MKTIPTLWWGWRVLDVLLVPLMWVLNECRWERPQETHPWHGITWTGTLNHELAVFEPGLQIADSDNPKGWWDPRIHMPMLGSAWKQYIVLQPSNYDGIWHYGWSTPNGKPTVHRLELKCGEPVRGLVFKGSIRFFATDADYNQIRLQKIGEGVLGDHKFANIRQL